MHEKPASIHQLGSRANRFQNQSVGKLRQLQLGSGTQAKALANGLWYNNPSRVVDSESHAIIVAE